MQQGNGNSKTFIRIIVELIVYALILTSIYFSIFHEAEKEEAVIKTSFELQEKARVLREQMKTFH